MQKMAAIQHPLLKKWKAAPSDITNSAPLRTKGREVHPISSVDHLDPSRHARLLIYYQCFPRGPCKRHLTYPPELPRWIPSPLCKPQQERQGIRRKYDHKIGKEGCSIKLCGKILPYPLPTLGIKSPRLLTLERSGEAFPSTSQE